MPVGRSVHDGAGEVTTGCAGERVIATVNGRQPQGFVHLVAQESPLQPNFFGNTLIKKEVLRKWKGISALSHLLQSRAGGRK